MKILGKIVLPEKFEWSPHQLLSMTKEIDRICPEEGRPGTQDIDHQQRPEEETLPE
jgi:hypothetical protein